MKNYINYILDYIKGNFNIFYVRSISSVSCSMTKFKDIEKDFFLFDRNISRIKHCTYFSFEPTDVSYCFIHDIIKQCPNPHCSKTRQIIVNCLTYFSSNTLNKIIKKPNIHIYTFKIINILWRNSFFKMGIMILISYWLESIWVNILRVPIFMHHKDFITATALKHCKNIFSIHCVTTIKNIRPLHYFRMKNFTISYASTISAYFINNITLIYSHWALLRNGNETI